ncbi:MAG: hypothetical protein WCO82_02435 [Sphingomonadales bacterium]
MLPVLVAGCAQPRIDVVSNGDRAAIGARPMALAPAAGDAGLVARLVEQGVVSALGTATAPATVPAPIVVQLGATSRPETTGICLEPGATSGSNCLRWAAEPVRRWRPYGRRTVHQVVVRFGDAATGDILYQVAATTARRKSEPAKIRGQLVDAAIACSGCAGGPLASH